MKKTSLCTRSLIAIALAGALAGCGGGGSTTNVALGGTVSGLTANGLVLTDSVTTVTLAANTTSFTFPSRVNVGASYAVSVQTQPTGLTCHTANASGVTGTSDISNVQVTCVPNHSVGGTIVGLTSAGLELVNGSDSVHPAANDTAFVFPNRIGEGDAYGVTILTQPAPLTCSVQNGTGFVGTTDVTSVQVICK